MSIAVRLPPHLTDRARQIAADMSQLSRYELLSISPKAVLRIALVEGAHLVERVDPKYLRPEHAASLRDQLQFRINNLNVMLTDGSYVDLVFMTTVVEWGHVRASVDEETRSKEIGIDIRLPPGRLDEVEAAITKGLKQGIPSRSAMVRILLEVGLVRIEARTYWDRRREGFVEDRAGNLQPPRKRAPRKEGSEMSTQTVLQATATFHRLNVYSLDQLGHEAFEILVKPDLDQPGAGQEPPTVFRCSNAEELRSCFEKLGVDGTSRQLGERADVPLFLHVPCTIDEAVARAQHQQSCTFIASDSSIPVMRGRIDAVKNSGIRSADRVSF